MPDGKEHLFRELLGRIPAGIFQADAVGACKYANERWCEIAGISLYKALGQGWLQCVHPDDRERVANAWHTSVRDRRRFFMEYRFRHASDMVRWVLEEGVPELDSSGQVTGYLATVIDVTSSKQAEDECQRFFGLVPDLVCVASIDGHFLKLNHAWQETLGYTEQELLSRPFLEFIHPEDREPTLNEVARQLAGESTLKFSNRYRCKDGSYRWLEWKATPAVDGKLLFASARDVTEHKRVEVRAQQSEAKRKAFMENISDTIWLIGANLDITYVSPGITHLLEIQPEELIGKPSALVVHPDDMDIVNQAQRHVIEHPGEPHTVQYRVRHRKGHWVHVESTGVNLLSDPSLNGILVTMRDISEHKRIEEELKRIKQRYDFATAVGRVGTWDWNPGTGELAWSDETFRLLGFVPWEVIPSYELFLGLVHPEDREALDRAVQAALYDGKPYDLDCRIILNGEAELTCHIVGKVELDSARRPQRMLGTIQDITTRKITEDRLRQSEANLRAILDNSPYLTWLKDTEGRYITANLAHASYARQKDVHEIEGKTDFDLWPKELAEKYRADDAEVIATALQKHMEEPSFDGTRTHWVETYKTPIIDATGRILGTAGFARDITERKQAEQALAESESRFREIFNTVSEAIFIHDTETGRIVDVNLRMCEMYGVTREEALACGPDDLSAGVPPYSSTEAFEKIHLALTKGPQVFDWLARARDGHFFWVEVSLRLAKIGEQTRILAVVRDISERKHLDAELRIAAIAFESQDGMVVTDANTTILRVNRAFTEITGYTAEEAVGKTPRLLKSDQHDPDFYRSMWKKLLSEGTWHGEIWNRRKNGEIYPEQLTITAVKGDTGEVTHYVATMRDITERKAAEAEIFNLAFYDSLTKLPNRRLLDDRLKRAMAASKRSGLYGALMFLDLDNFKPLNDTHGHDVGDLLLIEAAQRIASCVREVDTVARFGGDEFVVLLSELEEDEESSRKQAGVVADKIRAILDKPYALSFQHEGQAETTIEHRCTSSIGVAMFLEHKANPEDILKWADIAMYQAKEQGGNRVHFYGN